LCPDLSATVFGARIALAAMATALAKRTEADRWIESAEQVRRLILEKLYIPEDAAFYDLDAENHFVKVRSDILSRVCGEHVVDRKTFDSLWERQIHNPKAFWAPFPLPSIALDDPTFVRPIPRNSWGGPSQALTALRAGRWFDFYGRAAEFSVMMDQWCEALQHDMTFRQQMDPLTGDFTLADKPGYSPASLVMMDYTWRLAGVREEGDQLEWNLRPGHAAAQEAHFLMRFGGTRTAEIRYTGNRVELKLDGRLLASMQGGSLRLLSDKHGHIKATVGISEATQEVEVKLAGKPYPRKLTLKANQRIALPFG